MHVLYFPLITDDVATERPDAGWTRQIIRDTPNGWRCVLVFRPNDDLDEYAVWERTRDLVGRLDSSMAQGADSAYLLAQRIVKLVRESGVDAGEAFRYAMLVSDGHKLHFYLKGFRCLLWGVPVEGSPSLRLAQEDKQNVIESRDFPSLQRRDLPQAAPFVADPIVAIVDRVEPDGLLTSFTKTLEGLLALAGPVSLHRRQSADSARGDAAMWHLWEEMANLAAVDLRRLETKLDTMTDRLEVSSAKEGRLEELWRRGQPWLVPGLLALNLLLLLILLLRGAPTAPSVPPAPAPVASAPAANHGPASIVPALVPRLSPPVASGGDDSGRREPVQPDEPAADRPAPDEATGPAAVLAAYLQDTTSPDRIQFTRPVKQFIDGTVASYTDGGQLTDKARRTMVDVAAQLLTNRRCGKSIPPVRVDGDVGERTLEQVRRCAHNGDTTMDALLDVYGDRNLLQNLDALETRVAGLVRSSAR